MMQAMNMNQQKKLRGDILRNETMAKHTSWRTGGVASIFYTPVDLDDLSLFLSQQSENTQIIFVGLGSNLLVRDAGLDAVVICTSGVLNKIEARDDYCIYAETGVPSPKLAKVSAKQGLSGAEFLCGIPGTVGGALAMNAGAMSGDTWSIVKNITTIDQHGQIHNRSVSDFDIAYRSVKEKKSSDFKIGKNEWFIGATLQLQKGSREQSEQKIKSHLARRGATQPTQQPNAGSVFRNPIGDYAARLIESVGLKGYCIGGACVSEKHANFIINTGTATASDIESLINHVHQTVENEFKINLIREVRIIGTKSE
ncbi:UDP-N-acetylenolpyruvoylglucosamine reductase [hydrothermal vent metagenome]|uniref:UDP-N-acetylmuramate dehydrogenase n=1 Tax=hydrothermal vent metagenome TaxID=652676 RepID=A0A3B1AGR8_9ZZZZ